MTTAEVDAARTVRSVAKPWWNRRASSLPELLLQTLVVGGALLAARLVFDDSTRDAWLYSGLTAVVWLVVGLVLLWNNRT